MTSETKARKREAKSALEGQGYWEIVWSQFKKHPPGLVGLLIMCVLGAFALTAPLIANDRPIVAVYRGETVAPALKTYVDLWVPWLSLRYRLKSWKASDESTWFPFSDHYPQLEGKTWKDVKDSEDMGFSIWPIVPWNANQFDETSLKRKPSVDDGHVLGTDDQGRDVLARLIYGCVVTLLVGIVSMGIATIIGVTLGLTAGWFGGWVDMALSRVTEVVMTFPTFFLIIAAIAFLEPSIINIMVVIGLVRWTSIFRLMRGEVLKVRALDYVAAARGLGASQVRIMARHLFPNAVPPIFVSIAFGVAAAVLVETSLSFLGFGDPTTASWGEIVAQGRVYISQGLWHLTIYPGLAIFVTLTGFNLFGQALRDAMDPKLRF